MLEMRIHGYGGEGIVTLAELIATAAMKTGKKVQTLPHFGVERRGAPVKALVRLSDAPIYVHSQSYQPDILLVLNIKLLDLALSQGISEQGTVITNCAHAVEVPYPSKHIDATGIAMAEKLMAGSVPFINIPLAGAMCAHLGIPFAKMRETIETKWAGKTGVRNADVAEIAYNIMRGGEK